MIDTHMSKAQFHEIVTDNSEIKRTDKVGRQLWLIWLNLEMECNVLMNVSKESFGEILKALYMESHVGFIQIHGENGVVEINCESNDC